MATFDKSKILGSTCPCDCDCNHSGVPPTCGPITMPDYPADLLKFSAYKNVVNSYEAAEKLAIDKKLVLGEPAVIPFIYKGKLELLFAIGSADPLHPYIKSSVNLEILNDAKVQDSSTGDTWTLAEIINYINDNLVDKNDLVNDLLKDEHFVNSIINAVFEGDRLEKYMDSKFQEFKQLLVWKEF